MYKRKSYFISGNHFVIETLVMGCLRKLEIAEEILTIFRSPTTIYFSSATISPFGKCLYYLSDL